MGKKMNNTSQKNHVNFLLFFIFFLSVVHSQSEDGPSLNPAYPSSGSKKLSTGLVVGSVVVGGGSSLVMLFFLCLYIRKKIIIACSRADGSAINFHLLKYATNNFNRNNILGSGRFGTVYKGQLLDGTKIVVKRMNSSTYGRMRKKELEEFISEVVLISKVQHIHLVDFLGYCFNAKERILVYEYMPKGTLFQHLFKWKDEGLKPLEWTKRLSIALDVAIGVDYLHSLAPQSFIHMDLKSSNILLGDDMRAKVADFGLVRLAPLGMYCRILRIPESFGYMATEYEETVKGQRQATTKIDVFSFGVILMELITGRKAQDERQIDRDVFLVHWFKRMHNDMEIFLSAIDLTLNLDEETLVSISKVAELAIQCCAHEPDQRPNMTHAVNVLDFLIEHRKSPEVFNPDESDEICLNMIGRTYSQSSIPSLPLGFADGFVDGR